jgi:hypothetical protein
LLLPQELSGNDKLLDLCRPLLEMEGPAIPEMPLDGKGLCIANPAVNPESLSAVRTTISSVWSLAMDENIWTGIPFTFW